MRDRNRIKSRHVVQRLPFLHGMHALWNLEDLSDAQICAGEFVGGLQRGRRRHEALGETVECITGLNGVRRSQHRALEQQRRHQRQRNSPPVHGVNATSLERLKS